MGVHRLRNRTPRRAVLVVAAVLVVVTASPAVAQIPGTEGVTDPISDALPDTGGTLPDTGGSVPDTGGTLPDTGGTLPDTGGTLPDTGGSVPDTGGTLPDPNGTIGDADDQLTDTSGSVTGTAGSLSGAGSALDPVTGSFTGGISGSGKSGSKSGTGELGNSDKTAAVSGLPDDLAVVLGHEFESYPSGQSARAADRDPVIVMQSAAGDGPSPTSTLAELAEAAVEAAAKMAFPLALMVLVGGFLVAHGYVDRRDPKLALAPVDADDELLGFR